MTTPSSVSPLIHIGYHKTGTTWLQQHLFTSEESGFASPLDKSEDLSEYVTCPNALDFDAVRAREYLDPIVCEVAKIGMVPVITSERLSGSPHSGGFDSKDLADRLHKLFPQGRILMVIREQNSMILSVYKQYLKSGGTGTIDQYLNPPSPKGGKKLALFSFDFFKYHRLISYYHQCFGKDRVLVLPYEMFRREPQLFVDRITDFAGARRISSLPLDEKLNAGQTPFVAASRQKLNFIARRSQVNPSVLWNSDRVRKAIDHSILSANKLVPGNFQKKIDSRMRTRIAELVGTRYQESNRLTAEMIHIELSEYGYDL